MTSNAVSFGAYQGSQSTTLNVSYCIQCAHHAQPHHVAAATRNGTRKKWEKRAKREKWNGINDSDMFLLVAVIWKTHCMPELCFVARACARSPDRLGCRSAFYGFMKINSCAHCAPPNWTHRVNCCICQGIALRAKYGWERISTLWSGSGAKEALMNEDC